MKPTTIDPKSTVCPLCGNSNNCTPAIQATDESKEFNCWCADPELEFPKALLASLPKDKKGAACICRECVLKYQQQTQ